MAEVEQAGKSGIRMPPLPVIVAVTGHRDLLPAETAEIRQAVRDFLEELASSCPNSAVTVMTSLADGAGQLVAEVADSLDLPFIVLLPVPRVMYREDFRTTGRRENFDRLCDAAASVIELPIASGNSAEAIREGGEGRARQDAQATVFLATHCHVVLALWDGKDSTTAGGTSQTVRFRQHRIEPAYAQAAAHERLLLVDDESDLVYHIVCSRNRADGQPRGSLQPLECRWLTADYQAPATEAMPARHRSVFERSDDFSRDAQERRPQMHSKKLSLTSGEGADGLPRNLAAIDRLFGIADWMAKYYERRSLQVLGAVHVLALLMGIMYIIYTNVFSDSGFIVAFVVLFALTTAVSSYGKSRDWTRRALDYRSLAEGLRVQYFWGASGVADDPAAQKPADSFLQMQDAELGWIRNVMRAAALFSDAQPQVTDDGLEFTEREWIGDEDSGRLGRYRALGEERFRKQRNTERQSLVGLWIGIVAIVVIVVIGVGGAEQVRDPLIWLMGVIVLLAAVRWSWSLTTADEASIRRFQFMAGVYRNTRRRLRDSVSTEERRRVLRALGEAVLEEHGRWMLLRRERSQTDRQKNIDGRGKGPER